MGRCRDRTYERTASIFSRYSVVLASCFETSALINAIMYPKYAPPMIMLTDTKTISRWFVGRMSP